MNECPRLLGILWRQHCWHPFEYENILFGRCNVKRNGWQLKCCRCPRVTPIREYSRET